MQSMIEEYTVIVDEITITQTKKATFNNFTQDSQVVILTGSTGALGSYMLDTLLNDPAITHIYCLNRVNDSQILQKERNTSRGVPTAFPSDRVTFLTTDLTLPALGIDPAMYNTLLHRTTRIVHNAWPMNFNLSLPSFRPSLSGVMNLLKLAVQCSLHPSILFVSSISSVSALPSPVPETIITDLKAPLPIGYAQSKFQAELLLSYAAAKLPALNISIARIGQVAGPVSTDGLWNRQEWIPSMVISSQHLGIVPETLGSESASTIDWVPIDLLAGILVELCLLGKGDSGSGKAKVYHPLNPKPTTWQAILPFIIDALSSSSSQPMQTLNTTSKFPASGRVKSVPFTQWLQALRKEAESIAASSQGAGEIEKMIDKLPAIKLLSFYESLIGKSMPILETGNAMISKKYESLEGIKEEWIKKWVWGWVGQ